MQLNTKLLLLFSLFWSLTFAQDKPKKIEGLDIYSYSVFTETDTIEYIKIGGDTSSSKPVILFLQGSLPRPLIMDFGNFKHINLPFDHKAITDKYHLIVTSMPHTPVVVGKSHLNTQYCYVPDTTDKQAFHPAYLKGNNLQNYVRRTNNVITDLADKSWVKKDSIHLIGHSQGAKIATVVASENKFVSSVSLLGFNPFGRFDQLIREEREKMKSGQISPDRYHRNIVDHYRTWQDINETPDDHTKGHNAWVSFSIDYTPYLMKINVPVFVGYGTEDVIAENCDLLPLKFIRNGKSNLMLKPYVALDHNFFELKDGVPDRRNGAHFSDVMNDIVDWIE